MSQKSKKAPSRSLLKSLTYGSGAFLFDSVNAFTPHGSGAVDIMAVRQKDGQIKSSPFYVRFGKYQSFRRNRQVRIKVNGVLMDFHLELGQYGSAFFAHTRDEEVLSDGDGEEGVDGDDHSLGMMSPVAAYEADYMSLVQGAEHAATACPANRKSPLRRHTSASLLSPDAASPASPSTLPSPPLGTSLPLHGNTAAAPGRRVLRCGSGPAASAAAPISTSMSPATPASPPILANPAEPSPAAPLLPGAALRCGHDWRDVDRSCTPRANPAAPAATPADAAPADVPLAVSEGGGAGGHLSVDASHQASPAPTTAPAMVRGDSCGSLAGPVQPEDVPDSAAALQTAVEKHAAAAVQQSADQESRALGPVAPVAPRSSTDVAYRQLGFDAPTSAARSQPSANGQVNQAGAVRPAEGGLMVRLVVDDTGRASAEPFVHVRISPWARNVSLLSAAGLACIRTSLDHSTSNIKPALMPDPSIDFAPATNVRDLASMSSFTAVAAPAAAAASGALPGQRREVSDGPSDTEDSSLDDTSDEEDGSGRRKHLSAPPDIGTMSADTSGTANGGRHARHVSFRSWAGGYGTHAGGGDGGCAADGDDEDVVVASSPHAERMQIDAGAMHEEEVHSMEASVLAEALQATCLGGSSPGDAGAGRGRDEGRGQVSAPGEAGGADVRRSSSEVGDGVPDVEVAACGHMLSPDVPPSALAALFDEHRVSAADVVDRGAAALPLDKLAVRISGRVYRYADVAPLLLSLQLYGGPLKRWQRLMPADGGFECPQPQPLDRKMKRRRTWWASMFWGASSRDAAVAPPAAALTATSSLDYDEAAAAAAHGATPERALHGGNSAQSASKGRQPPRVKRVRHVKVQSTHPTSEQLQAMAEHLQPGQNTVEFSIGSQRVQSFVHLFEWNIRLVVSDIDGTITRSDVLGHVLTPLGVDWTHPGVTRLFSNVSANGYQFVYLSSRSIAQSGITRAFLETLKQQDHALPAGPVIISPHGIIPSLYREMIRKRPEEFKMAALQGIRSLFPNDWNPFYSGFGNRGSDDISYLHVGVPPHRIFTINPAGRVRQLSEPAASGRFDSLSKIDDQVDLLFPVTETARRRLFAAQASGGSRHAAAAAAVAAASAAAAASLAPSLGAAATGGRFFSRETPEATDATTAANVAAGDSGAAAAAAAAAVTADAAADDAEADAGGEAAGPSRLLGTRLVPMETQEEALGLRRMTREGSDHSFDAQVDVDTRDEFNDNNFWRTGMDSVAAGELEDLLADAS
eukprot:jgi/Ulvmu1/8672/UM047_0010.1